MSQLQLYIYTPGLWNFCPKIEGRVMAEDGEPWAVSIGWRRSVTYIESSRENANQLQGNLAQLQTGVLHSGLIYWMITG
jgi:hypothetical protein